MVLQVDCVQLQDLVMGRKDYLDRATVREEVMMIKRDCRVKTTVCQMKIPGEILGQRRSRLRCKLGYVLSFFSFIRLPPSGPKKNTYLSNHHPDMPAIPAQSQIFLCELCPEMPGWNTQAQINAHRRKSHIHSATATPGYTKVSFCPTRGYIYKNDRHVQVHLDHNRCAFIRNQI